MARPKPKITAEFRPACAEDEDAVLRFMRALEAEDPGRTPFDEEQRRHIFREFGAKPALGAIWLIEVEGKAAGYAILTFGYSFEFGGRDAFVDELYIAREHRGRGIGKTAMAVFEAEARKCGVQALHLGVTNSNSVAIKTYTRAGFSDHEGRRIMTKRL